MTDPLPIRLDTLDPRKVCVRATTCDLKSCVKPMLNYQPFRPLLQWSISWWLRNWVKKDGCVVWCSSCWARNGELLWATSLYTSLCYLNVLKLLRNLSWTNLIGWNWWDDGPKSVWQHPVFIYIYTSFRWFLFSLIIQESYAVELIRCNGKDIHAYIHRIYIYSTHICTPIFRISSCFLFSLTGYPGTWLGKPRPHHTWHGKIWIKRGKIWPPWTCSWRHGVTPCFISFFW